MSFFRRSRNEPCPEYVVVPPPRVPPRNEPCPEYVVVPPPRVPRFCKRSGDPLTRHCDQVGFDEATGEPKYNLWLACPKYTGGFYKRTVMGGMSARLVLPDWSDFRDRSYYFATYTEDYHDCDPEYLVATPTEPRTTKPRPSKKAAKR